MDKQTTCPKSDGWRRVNASFCGRQPTRRTRCRRIVQSGMASVHRLVALVLVFLGPFTAKVIGDTQGPPRPARLTLTNKTDHSVTLSWSAPTNGAAVGAYEVFADDQLLGLSTSNSFYCDGLTQDHPYVFRVRSRNEAGKVSEKSNALLATPQSGRSLVQPLEVRTQYRALVLNYDPQIRAEGASVRASDYYRFRDVSQLASQFIELLRRASGGQVVWSVTDRYDLEEFAPAADSSKTLFNASNYVALSASGYNYDVSYDALIHDPRFGIVEKANAGLVDAIWVFGMPNINFWETAMAGPNPYWINGAPIPDGALRRNIVFYGFGKAPHQGVGFMCENTCHMTENILARISENWPRTVATPVFQSLRLNDPGRVLSGQWVNDWTHFTQAEAASWNPVLVAPGNAQAGLSHYPPTALYNYDWSTLSLNFSDPGPFQACDGDWAIVGGQYRVLAANSAKTLALDGTNPQAFSDADVELTVRAMNASYPAYAGLLFRLSACQPGNNQATGYYLALNPYEKRVILARLQNQFIALTNAPCDVRANFNHRLRLQARGPRLQVFLDGNLAPLITCTDDSFVTGGFGLSAYFTDAFFDDLTVVPHVSSTADQWYHYPAANAPVRDLTPGEWNGEGAPAMDGFYAWWWEHLPKNGGAHFAADPRNGTSAWLLNHWWPYVFDINRFTNTWPASDMVFPAEDVSPPTPPADAVGLALASSQIGLAWSEPWDDVGVTRYTVYRDGVFLRKTPLTFCFSELVTARRDGLGWCRSQKRRFLIVKAPPAPQPG